jgi:hypothetical protein
MTSAPLSPMPSTTPWSRLPVIAGWPTCPPNPCG